MRPHVTYLRSRHVATMTAAGVIADGCVVVADGRIVDVGLTRDLKPTRIDADIDGLLTPGLINAHTHLELTNVPRPPVPGTFQNWLWTTMASMRRPDADAFARERESAVREGITQCLAFGVTGVGDISQNVDVVRPVLAASPLRVVSFGECLGLGPRRARFEHLLGRAMDPTTATPRMRIGVAPHAPYTVDARGYAESKAAGGRELGRFWTTHLAETPDEAAFLRDRSGPFARLYERLGFDPRPADGFDGSPVAWLDHSAGMAADDLLVHCNYCTDDDLDRIAARRAVVVWCPRTHAYFGHPPHRWRSMRERGIRVCVGTDSCASSPDLNVMDDLRLVRRQNPDVPADTLWRMVTCDSADALRRGDAAAPAVGRLAVDVAADLAAWPTRGGEPLVEVLDDPSVRPLDTWVGGLRWSQASCR